MKKLGEPLAGAALFSLGTLLIMASSDIAIDVHLFTGVVMVACGVALWIAIGR